MLTGASRADFAVRCSNDSTITINGSTVASVLVSGAGNTTVGPYSNGSTGSTWSASRPAYLRDLRGVPSAQLNVASVRMGARTLNGSKFDHDIPTFSFSADKAQEWGISGNTQHPFHLHVYHFQAQDCTGDYENGEYYDTITSACSVRFDLNAATTTAYEGRTIMHCHILEHEDQGAMGWMDVIGGLPPPAFPLGTAYSEYYTLGATTPVCGDATCDGSETQCSCPSDCGADPACQASGCDNDGLCEVGEDCSNCGADCASVTGGRPATLHCCGDGIVQSAEGDGSICDGNF